ncbi:hypothetical protein V2H45_23310 [Tumidithrix elongata RA019]|uniref:Uncharacterized protein n=1 Tax=Tumidithrix elongata BACA0141 TaxID=2716417 RepID=A0AAW9PX97_9CYAN|nr:hypothetical protein [Tumidithrix elongata RA019]
MSAPSHLGKHWELLRSPQSFIKNLQHEKICPAIALASPTEHLVTSDITGIV